MLIEVLLTVFEASKQFQLLLVDTVISHNITICSSSNHAKYLHPNTQINFFFFLYFKFFLKRNNEII